MLHHGLLIARAPLTPMERRLLAITLATTHTSITSLFRKFGVSGRSGLTTLWLGRSPA